MTSVFVILIQKLVRFINWTFFDKWLFNFDLEGHLRRSFGNTYMTIKPATFDLTTSASDVAVLTEHTQ